MNFAPAATARSTCSVVRTVPAPTNISGYFSVMIRMDSSAASVRKVTSAHGSPPWQSAFANGSASFTSFNTTTGTTPNLESCSKTAFIISSLNFKNKFFRFRKFHNVELCFTIRYLYFGLYYRSPYCQAPFKKNFLVVTHSGKCYNSAKVL